MLSGRLTQPLAADVAVLLVVLPCSVSWRPSGRRLSRHSRKPSWLGSKQTWRRSRLVSRLCRRQSRHGRRQSRRCLGAGGAGV